MNRIPPQLALWLMTAAGLAAQVEYQRILNAEREPCNWLTYSGTYAAHRFSPLTQINRTNVARLKLAWMYLLNKPGLVT